MRKRVAGHGRSDNEGDDVTASQRDAARRKLRSDVARKQHSRDSRKVTIQLLVFDTHQHNAVLFSWRASPTSTAFLASFAKNVHNKVTQDAKRAAEQAARREDALVAGAEYEVWTVVHHDGQNPRG
jgi:hypothetical protein